MMEYSGHVAAVELDDSIEVLHGRVVAGAMRAAY